MDVSHLLDPLNDAQRAAVTAPTVPLLILAGAGSGKTRVLTHLVGWLVQVENVSPFGILAVTFTNKAAGEMRTRIEQLLGTPAAGMWVGTFHGLAHRLLRVHWRDVDLPQTFQILDADDQFRLIKRVFRGLEIDETRWTPKQAQWFINGQKDEGRRPADIQYNGDPHLGHALEKVGADAIATDAVGLNDRTLVVRVPDAAWSGEIRLREGELVNAITRLAAGSGIEHIRPVPGHDHQRPTRRATPDPVDPGGPLQPS